MKRVLVIDQGNSSTKVTVFDGKEAVSSLRLDAPSVEDLEPLIGENGVYGAIMATVARTDVRFVESLRLLIDGPLILLTHDTPLPIRIGYDTPRTLGADRIAAAAGAYNMATGERILVVDAGTALTIDLMESDGLFAGGNISPGMRMRFESLHSATGKLPLVCPEGAAPEFGRDTEQAIRSGVVRGMAAEILNAYRLAWAGGAIRIIMTGGDATLLARTDELRSLPVEINDNLVGVGLNYIYRYNETL